MVLDLEVEMEVVEIVHYHLASLFIAAKVAWMVLVVVVAQFYLQTFLLEGEIIKRIHFVQPQIINLLMDIDMSFGKMLSLKIAQINFI